MPALSSLPELLSKNPAQKASFNRNESQARELAEKVHLIHVSVPGDPATKLDEFLNEPPLNPDGSELFCEELELWVTQQLGI